MQAGRFREDLFYRLNVVELRLPPLRERTGDIPLLVNHYLERLARENNRPVPAVTPEALEALTQLFAADTLASAALPVGART